MSGRGLPSRDMERIGGRSYGTSIYVGGVTSTTGRHVASAADPVVGFNNYCHSGRTTGEHCGHTVNSVNATVCTSSGCKSPVTAFSGGVLPQPGDSGSPFYANSGGLRPRQAHSGTRHCHRRRHRIRRGKVESCGLLLRGLDRNLTAPTTITNGPGAERSRPGPFTSPRAATDRPRQQGSSRSPG